MIVTVLLILIYMAFVSLGLPDGVMGVAWPLMYVEFDVPLSFISIMSIPGTIGAVTSSLIVGKLLKKFKPVHIVITACFLTGLSLIGYSFAPNIWVMILLNFPFGLGAGGVDATLNDFVSRHFTAKHMNWLHASYGIGTTIGPFIMTQVIARLNNWRPGHRTVGFMQIGLGILFILTIAVWSKAKPFLRDNTSAETKETKSDIKLKKPKLTIARLVASFAIYTGMEAIIVTWIASYFNIGKGFSLVTAGHMSTVFFASFVVGRILSGVVVEKLTIKGTIFDGIALTLIGVIVLIFSGKILAIAVAGVILIGVGCAPIYPCMMQQTPLLVPEEYSSSTIGYQMAGANIAYLTFPYIVGFICERTTLLLFPIALLVALIALVVVKIIPEFKKV